jgi:drug/metabolite transporter (DMT)-like permease
MEHGLLKSGAMAGIFWMCMATFFHSVMGAQVRSLGGEIPVIELVFFRNLIGVLVLVPWLLTSGGDSRRLSQLPIYALRICFAYISMVLLFYALSELPLANVYALQYTIPLFTILLAVLVLKQQSSIHNWVACLVGFCGVLIVIRPGIVEMSVAAFAALGAALLSGGSNTTLKLLSRTEGSGTVTFYSNLLMLPLALLPTLYFWVTPSWPQIPWLIGIGLFGVAGGYCFIRAVGAADARIVQPFQFTRMFFGTALGYFLFLELPDFWTWVGAAVIFLATYYIIWHEAQVKKSNEVGSVAGGAV